MSNPPAHPASPCINECTLDAETQLCKGCFRTLDEIAEWSIMTAERKLAVLDAVAVRRAAREGSDGKHSG